NEWRHRLRAVRGESVGPLDVFYGNAFVQLEVARLMAQRVDVRAAVLHHGQHARRARPRPVFLRPIRVAMAAMERVKIPGLVRGMDRHAGEPWLLEIEDLRARQLFPQRHRILARLKPSRRAPGSAEASRSFEASAPARGASGSCDPGLRRCTRTWP